MRTYLSNRMAICPRRHQRECRATAQSHCRLCNPRRRQRLIQPRPRHIGCTRRSASKLPAAHFARFLLSKNAHAEFCAISNFWPLTARLSQCPLRSESGRSAALPRIDAMSNLNGLRCLPALNGATDALGNFPECLTWRNQDRSGAREAYRSSASAAPRASVGPGRRRLRTRPSTRATVDGKTTGSIRAVSAFDAPPAAR